MTDGIRKHAFKIQVGTACAVGFFLVIATMNFSKAMSNFENNQINLQEQSEENQRDIEENKKRSQKCALQYVEISTKLTGIDSRLIQIQKKIN